MLANVPRPGKDFGGAARYLIHGSHGAKPNPHRVLWTQTRHLMTDDPMSAAKIMTATAALSARVERPVYHLIVSWASTERPARNAIEQVIATTLADIGLDQHQVLAIAHGDTANRHVHLLVNRVHPDTGVAWSTKHDYRRIERSMFRQACSMGFSAVPGRHSRPDHQTKPIQVRSKQAMLASRTNPSMPKPWSRAEIAAIAPTLAAILSESRSWSDAVARIEAFGGRLERKGQGLIIGDQKRTGYVKLSSLTDAPSLRELERRLGAAPPRDVLASGIQVPNGATANKADTPMDRALGRWPPHDPLQSKPAGFLPAGPKDELPQQSPAPEPLN